LPDVILLLLHVILLLLDVIQLLLDVVQLLLNWCEPGRCYGFNSKSFQPT
jgi:hypothetical protein